MPDPIKIEPDVVAALGNEMLSASTRLRGKPAAVGASDISGDLGHAGEGAAVGQTYSAVAQAGMDAVDALCGAMESNAQYVLYAAQQGDDAFN